MSGMLQPIKFEDGSRSPQTQQFDPPGVTARKLQQYLFEIERESADLLMQDEVFNVSDSLEGDVVHAGFLKLRYRLSEEEYYEIYNDGVEFFSDPHNAREKSVICHSWPYGPLRLYSEYKEPEPTEGMLYFVRAAVKPQRKNWPWTNRGSQTMGRLRVRYWQHKRDPNLKRRLMSVSIPHASYDEVPKPVFSLCHVLYHRSNDTSATDEPTDISL